MMAFWMDKQSILIPYDLLMLPMITQYADMKNTCSRNFLLEIDPAEAEPVNKLIRGCNIKPAVSNLTTVIIF